jgi:hypothetical protein
MSIRFNTLALAGALAVAAPATVFAAPAAPTILVGHAEKAPAQAPSSEASRYAEREAQDTSVTDYEGGSTFVITMSGTTLAIILVLLILL